MTPFTGEGEDLQGEARKRCTYTPFRAGQAPEEWPRGDCNTGNTASCHRLASDQAEWKTIRDAPRQWCAAYIDFATLPLSVYLWTWMRTRVQMGNRPQRDNFPAAKPPSKPQGPKVGARVPQAGAGSACSQFSPSQQKDHVKYPGVPRMELLTPPLTSAAGHGESLW